MQQLLIGTSIRSFEQLEQGLRNWCNIGGAPDYDAVGMITLLVACLDNLRANLPDDILADHGATLSEGEVAILKVMLSNNEFVTNS